MKQFIFYFYLGMLMIGVSCQRNTESTVEDCPCQCDHAREIDDPNSIRFLATADPQYNYEEMNPNLSSVINSDSIGAIISRKLCCGDYRGVIISGDLTHNSRLDEFEKYQSFIRCFKPYAFDGIGNHDYSYVGEDGPVDLAPSQEYGLDKIIPGDKLYWDSASIQIWDEVRTRQRIPAVETSFPNIHYSWDWEDVHFVQLNIYPGDQPVSYKGAKNPFRGYTYLKNDLEKNVGDSGRPVVLAHHYGMDKFSRGVMEDGTISPEAEWWTENDRKKYWDLLQSYNVILILTGHAHYCDECYLPWDGESIGVGNVGPDFIPTFITGAAREAKYVECAIEGDQLTVKRYLNGVVDIEETFDIKRGVR